MSHGFSGSPAASAVNAFGNLLTGAGFVAAACLVVTGFAAAGAVFPAAALATPFAAGFAAVLAVFFVAATALAGGAFGLSAPATCFAPALAFAGVGVFADFAICLPRRSSCCLYLLHAASPPG
ncbi:conserved membrane hypothetical protein [Mesorhizobium metallidurans STM 2683]|uniref:Uncharacterized protein n=1 Tax=Mesorhizobium metallidurans STM 2683 TaxID=1297569 RepID=M5EGX5_9HYPH|nr:conserved membrane hypothetical protein [Mesorhizobium metallidurans STM 2683]